MPGVGKMILASTQERSFIIIDSLKMKVMRPQQAELLAKLDSLSMASRKTLRSSGLAGVSFKTIVRAD